MTLARIATGKYALIGPALVCTLGVFPVVLFVPLLTTKLFFYSRNDLVLARGAYDLFHADRFLFVIVFLFGIVIPLFKMVSSVLCWYYLDIAFVARHADKLCEMGRLAMLDVMLLAIFVIAFKGVGLGSVEIKYGLYLYTLVILASLVSNLAMKRAVVNCRGREDSGHSN